MKKYISMMLMCLIIAYSAFVPSTCATALMVSGERTEIPAKSYSAKHPSLTLDGGIYAAFNSSDVWLEYSVYSENGGNYYLYLLAGFVRNSDVTVLVNGKDTYTRTMGLTTSASIRKEILLSEIMLSEGNNTLRIQGISDKMYLEKLILENSPPHVNQQEETVIDSYSYTDKCDGLLFEKGYIVLNSKSTWTEYTVVAENSGLFELYITAGTVFSVSEVYLVVNDVEFNATVLAATSAYHDTISQYMRKVALHQGINKIRICHKNAGLYFENIILKPYNAETLGDIPKNGELSLDGASFSETNGEVIGTTLVLDENESVTYNVKAPFDGNVRTTVMLSGAVELMLNETESFHLTTENAESVLTMLEGNNIITLKAVNSEAVIQKIDFYTKGSSFSGDELKILSYSYDNSSGDIIKEAQHISFRKNHWTEYHINAENAGSFLLYIGISTIYNNDSKMEIAVNGEKSIAVLEATNNTKFTADRFAVCIKLFKGFNTIKITNLSAGIYFDYIKLGKDKKPIENLSEIDANDYLYGYNPVKSLKTDGVALSDSYWLKYDVSVKKEGFYRITLNALSDSDTTVYVSQGGRLLGVVPVYETTTGKTGTHIGYVNLKEGISQIKLTLSKGNIDLSSISIVLTEDKEEEFLENIKTASVSGIKTALNDYVDFTGVNVEEKTEDIFYEAFVYESLHKKNFTSASEVIYTLLKSIELEKTKPSICILKGEEKLNSLVEGTEKLLIDGSRFNNKGTLVCAVYQGGKLVFLYTDDSYGENVREVSLKESQIDYKKPLEFKVMELDSLAHLSPLNPANKIKLSLYVSPNGDDTQSGTIDKPFKTLKRAKEKVTELSEGAFGDVVINLLPGTHFISQTEVFDETHGREDGYSLIIRGADKDKPSVMSGGVKVSGWKEDANGIWKAPFSYSGIIRNLYVNNIPAERAKSDEMTVKGIYDDDVTQVSYDGVLTSDNKALSLKNPEDCELVFNIHWAQHRIPAKKTVKSGTDTAIILDEETFGIAAQMDGYTQVTEGATFYIENDLSLLDNANEFYYDKASQTLYYKPSESTDMKTAEVIVPTTEGLIKIEGKNKKVKNITFENIAFSHSAFSFVTDKGLVNRQADYFYRNDSGETVSYKMTGQITVKKAEGIQFKNCVFSGLGSAAIDIYDGVSNVLIEGNVFKDIAGGGIIVGSIEPAKAESSEEICTDINILNNVFRNIGYEYFCQTGVSVYYANTVKISHNDMANQPYLGISLGWGWGDDDVRTCGGIEVSHNRIISVMEKLYDGSHIYTLGPLRDTAIRENYMESSTCSQFGGIYTDQGSGYMHITDNIIIDCQNWFFTGLNRTHDLYVSGNMSDSASYIKRGEDNFYEDALDLSRGWTEEAAQIYEKSGLEEKFRSILNYQ